ncbi:MAG: DNA polymerase III subunit delta' [Deltaproteobacteria bacterium]
MDFKRILGHKKEIDMLQRAMRSGRLHHAYLFTGPEGIGKKEVAFAFARALNCASPVDNGLDSCGSCNDCSMMDARAHPNLACVYPTDKDGERCAEGLIRIEDVRQVQGVLRYRAMRGKKIAVIDDSEKMMPAAANAFLKTLEEPPPDSMIILVTQHPAGLLPTILSRCQRIGFRPLPKQAVQAFLMETPGMGAEAAEGLAGISSGSLSLAVRYSDSEACEKKLEYVKRLFLLEPKEEDLALKLAEEISKRDDLDEILEFVKMCLRRAALSMEGVGLDAHFQCGQDRPKWAVDSNKIISSYSLAEEARRSVLPPRYANKLLALEALFLNLIAADCRAEEC